MQFMIILWDRYFYPKFATEKEKGSQCLSDFFIITLLAYSELGLKPRLLTSRLHTISMASSRSTEEKKV